MKNILRIGIIAGLVSSLPIFASLAISQDYPSKAVSLVVAFPAGGGADILARALGQELGQNWKQTVLIDNKPGAGTTIAAATVARAAPDGHTLYLANLPVHAVAATLYRQLPYDTLKSFTPISLVAKGAPLILVVNPSIKAESLNALVELAKSKPGGLSYASVGAGSAVHLTAEMFSSQAAVKLLHVPFKGGSPAQLAVVSGEVDSTLTDPSVLPLIKDGKLRALAVTSLERWAQLPEIPTVAESGFRGFESIGTIFLVGPAGMRREIVVRINETLQKATTSPGLQQRFAAIAYTLETSTPEALQTRIATDVEKFGRVIKALNLSAD